MKQEYIKLKSREDMLLVAKNAGQGLRFKDKTWFNNEMTPLCGTILQVSSLDMGPNADYIFSSIYPNGEINREGWVFSMPMIEQILTKEDNPEYFL